MKNGKGTLKREIAEIDRAWLDRNAVRQNFKYSRLRKLLSNAAHHPIYAVGCLVVLAAALTGVMTQGVNELFGFNAPWGSIDSRSAFLAIWDVQATVLAVIYPIVIAFVTIMLRRMALPNAFLEIYLVESAAKFSGLSALALLLWMGGQYLYLPHGPNGYAHGWLFVDLCWLVLNLGLTAHFAYRTIEFVRPSRRQQLVLQRVLNEWWPDQVRRTLASLFWYHAPDKQLIPNARTFALTATGPVAILGSKQALTQDHVFRLRSRGSRFLTDVRFAPLNRAITSWLRRARNRGHEGHMSFPVIPGEEYENGAIICAVNSAVPLSVLESTLIQLAFTFGRTRWDETRDVDAVFGTLKAEALASIRDGDTDGFAASMREFRGLYVKVVESSLFVNDGGVTENLAALRSERGLVGPPLYSRWLEECREIGSRAIDASRDTSIYIRRIVYLPAGVAADLQETGTGDVSARALRFQATIYLLFARWWRERCGSLTRSNSQFGKELYLEAASASQYREMLSVLIGAWEECKSYLLTVPEQKVNEWQVRRLVDVHTAHLETTAIMLLHAVHEGDAEGSWWFEDVLVKWLAGIEYKFSHGEHVASKLTAIRPELIDLPWTSVLEEVGLEEPIRGAGPQKWGVLEDVFSTIWRDTVIATALVLISESYPRPDDADFGMRLAMATVRLEGSHEGQEPYAIGRRIRHPEEMYAVLVWQVYGRVDHDKGQDTTVDVLIRHLRQAAPEDRVPGRIYSGWGEDGLASTRDAQLFLLVSMSTREWTPERVIERELSGSVLVDDDARRAWLRDIEKWIERLRSSEFARWQGKLDKLRKLYPDLPEFEDGRTRVADGLEAIRGAVEERRSADLESAEIDPERIKELEIAFSKGAFRKHSGTPPVSLFGAVSNVEEGHYKRRVRVKRYSKGRLTKPRLDSEIANEEEWLARLGSEHVAASVIGVALDQWDVVSEDGSTPDLFWAACRKHSTRIIEAGREPILLVENRTIPYWLLDWFGSGAGRRSRLPEDMTVWRSQEETRGDYIGNLGAIAVFRAPLPFGASFLTSNDEFLELEFVPVGTERWAGASTEEFDRDDGTVTLVFEWCFRATFGGENVVRVEYGQFGVQQTAGSKGR